MVRIPLANIKASYQGAGDDFRARTLKDDYGNDRHVASYVIRAYFMGLGLAPTIAPTITPHMLEHTREDNNNNTYTDGKGTTLQGRIDIYT